MKKITIVLVSLLLLLSISSCNKITHFPFDYTYHKSINIPQATIPGFTDSITLPVQTNIDSIMQANGSKPDLLQSAKLSALKMTITVPAGESFAFLHEVHIYVVTPQGIDLEIAHKNNVSTSSSSLDLDVDNTIELKPYLTADYMNLKLKTTTSAGMTQNMTVALDMKIHFEANLLKVL